MVTEESVAECVRLIDGWLKDHKDQTICSVVEMADFALDLRNLLAEKGGET